MKIIQFINTLQTGGAENIVKDYSLYLNKSNDLLVVTTFNSEGFKNFEILKKAGIKIQPLLQKKQISTLFEKIFWKIFGNLFATIKFKKILKNFKPDIVHCHLHAINIVSKSLNQLRNTKIFFTIHSKPEFYFEKESKVLKSIKKLTSKSNFTMIAIHDQMKNEIISKYGFNNVVRIYNPISDSFFGEDTAKQKVRSMLNIPTNAFVIGNVGRFSYQKNHSKIISIFEECLKLNTNCHLLLIGQGELKETIIEQLKNKDIQNKCTILENRADIHQLLKAMDVFLFPSISEGFGIALLEAQATGIPCLASSTIPEEAFINKNCLPIDINESSKKIALSTFKLSKCGVSNKMEKFKISNIMSELISLYKN